MFSLRAIPFSCWLPVLFCLVAVPRVSAEVELPSIFSDHMVLQSDVAVPVWGWATPLETVQVTIAGQSQTTQADNQGNWRVEFTPMAVGTRTAMTIKGSGDSSSHTIQDVLIGQVWLLAGDAQFSKSVNNERRNLSYQTNQDLPTARFFRIKPHAAKTPEKNAEGSWVVLDQQNVGSCSAIGFQFAKEMQAKFNWPLGIIEATDPRPVTIQSGGKVTGSTIEAWISEPALRALPAAGPIFQYYESPFELREALTEYEKALGDWKLRTGKAFSDELRELERREPDVWYDYVEELRKSGKPAPESPPRKPTAESLRMATTHAANLYNGMIAPLSRYALRGVVLSIGMANSPRAVQYRYLFPTLIHDWRRSWGREELPIIFLGQSRARHPNMDPRAIAELQEAQSAHARLPHTALVRTLDLGGNIFPSDLATLANRMVDAVSALTDSAIPHTAGPEIEQVTFDSERAIVHFRNLATGLANKGLTVRLGGSLKGFALAERQNRWVYADAKIDGAKVIVSHPKLKAPIALRYDWVSEPDYDGNLTDHSGQPALPFRSDDWPAYTATPAAQKPNALATIFPPDLYPVVDPSLPRVLLIGDSIKNGYYPYVKNQLEGKANVAHLVAFGMIGKQDADAAAFCAKFKDADYAVIHYNDGLHSLPPRITDEQFGIGLTAMLKHLKTIAPHVIWATTTPAPDRDNTLGPASQNATVVTRNRMSKDIAAKFDVPVNDLYELVIGQREKLQKFANLHFTPEGSQLMGEQVAAKILSALKTH